MLAPLRSVPGWPDCYRAVLDSDGLADLWNLGRVTSIEVSERFAAELGQQSGVILSHMRACSGRVTLFPKVMAVVARLRVPQAIVTINPDIFTDVVAPACRLDSYFPQIVTSWEEGTLSKADLCAIAISRLAADLEPSECLLVDNRLDNIEAWRGRGGAGLHFQGPDGFEAQFAAALAV